MIGYVMALSLAAVVMIGSGVPAWAAESPPASPLKVGEYAPRFLLKTLNPEESGMTLFSTKRFVGSKADNPKKAMLLSFAASHCKPCRKELPELKKLEARYRERGVITAVVVIDQEAEGIEAMRKLTVDELALDFPVLSDRFAVVGRRYGSDVLPLAVVVDDEGKVAWFRSGFLPDTIEQIAQQLESHAAPAVAPEPPPEEAPRPEPKKKSAGKGKTVKPQDTPKR